ncbi:serine-type endopeptidase inhibitor [Holotrichia oblita]|uniref:Serine-type endopeptidase inhibitor n=1 Tax=Holotrichia oblita TaxID=644536 RepID=A0ACB9SXA6_HOLOL|nr:serine-type endopeptidase inhibitor [Holotrichia oblita]
MQFLCEVLVLAVTCDHTKAAVSRQRRQDNWIWEDNPVPSTPLIPIEKPTPSTSTPTLDEGEINLCIKACPKTSEYSPVCATNGKTYHNEGKFKCAKQCGAGVLAVAVEFTQAKPSRVRRQYNVRDCIRKCPTTAQYNPVCGSDNITYDNEGKLTCARDCSGQDSCGGQNKNSVVMSMIGYWLALEAPVYITTVEFVLTIVGYSFTPPDRIFGLIKKEIRKISVIISKEEYEKIIQQHSTIKKIGRDWRIFDWKAETKKFTKVPGQWHFKFNPSKRFIFSKTQSSIRVRDEVHYRSDLCVSQGILKMNKKFEQFQPKRLNIQNRLKGDKSSIHSLLKKHYRDD